MAGGLGTSEHFTSLEPKVFVEEILGFERNDYKLRNVCRIVQVPNLQATVRLATRGSVDEKVKELEEPNLKRADYSTVSFSLWKNVGEVAFSDEARKRVAEDLMRLEIEDTARDLARAENSQIASALEAGGTTSAGHDWGGSNNPAEDILPKIADMYNLDLGYDPQDILMHPLVYADLITNDDVMKEVTHTQVMQTGRITSVYGLNVVIDINLTNTLAIILDRNAPACLLGLGGTSAARWRNEPAGYDAYIIRQWLQPLVPRANAVQILTGVHA
ncbi:hypothetical protein DRO54_05450 [Candidatus Bathyarchaeota archaeon]|nr:MAG: hypothetical protein DRO54_05450 [Candidatus Bathyarchaeota archaeon]RLI55411.1 MAG: hypothetical protein DRP09_09950 [Candidatus Thorarchaeota archaeon]